MWFFCLALFLGWVMGPATGSVMSSVPEQKSGVASAMNDLTRQVAGALGTAVIGSLITSLYPSKLSESTAPCRRRHARPARTRSAARRRWPRACRPARALSWRIPPASTAFTDALARAFLVAAAFAVIAAIVVWRRLPNDRAPEPETGVAGLAAGPSNVERWTHHS